MINPLIKTDSYKLSHWKQYPKGTQHIYSYIEPRKGSGEIPILGINEFVLQIMQSLSVGNVEELRELSKNHGVPFNTEGFDRLLEKYGATNEFPLLVRGVPEGTLVTKGTVVATIVNTDPEFPWLTSFFETLFLRCVWYPSTVSAISREAKKVILRGLELSGDPMTIDFKLVDFGARGVSSGESAAHGGAGHLMNFKSTDTLEAVAYLRDTYNVQDAGFSIPATEHSTVTSWGKQHERDMFEDFIRSNLGPGKLAACVSDSYNIWEALETWKSLEPVLLEVGGTLIIRPDSGDPVETPVKVVEELLNLFGSHTNTKGFRCLPDHIRVIQGDGIGIEDIKSIIDRLISKGISTDCIAFGMGGGLLQTCDRDTFGWAMKCSAARVDGVWRDVFKDPIGGGKTSKRGLVIAAGTIDREAALSPYVPLNDSYLFGSHWVTYYDGSRGYTRPPESWETIRDRCAV